MKKSLLLFAFIAGTLYISAQSTCGDALEITDGIYTVEEIAGTEIATPYCIPDGNPTLAEWYSYTSEEDLSVTISTDLPQNALLDTRVFVYSGSCDNRECVAADDDISGTNYLSIVSFNAQAGETYLIAFDNRWESNGFDFEVSSQTIITLPIQFVFQNIETAGSTMGVVDMNGDFLDDVVSVTGNSININYQQIGGGFQFITFGNPPVAHSPSWSMAAGDIDRNGYNDLLYGGGSGVSFMLANDNGFGYTEVTSNEYVFSQRSNFIDINNDGHLDAFVCHDVAPNVYYINDGNNNFIFNQGGLGDTPDGGNYGSIWVDYDSDGDQDLFIAKCRGGNSDANINQLHINNGDGTYTEIGEEVNLADNVQTWSSAWGDFDNDGDMDVFVGASSLFNGGHKLMINDGTNNFINQTSGSGFDSFNATSIENVAHDFNNDGFIDLHGAGNVIMMNNGNLTFTQVPVDPSNGPVGDLNNDGFLDIANGQTLYMNAGNDNNYIKINTIGVQSNINGIGARIMVYTPNLGQQMRDVRSGDSFWFMSSINAHFGIGTETQIDSVVIIWPSGIVDVYENPGINTTLVSNEGASEISVGVSDTFLPELAIFPNPVRNQLIFEAPVDISGSLIRIFDVAGKKVMEGRLNQNQIDVSGFTPGAYVLKLDLNGKSLQRKFVKL